MDSSNSSAAIAETLEVALRPSLRAFQWAVALHAVALVLVMVAMPDGIGMIAAAALVAASWLVCRRHPALGIGPRGITALKLDGEGGWQLRCGTSSNWRPAVLHPRSVVRGRWLVLRFDVENVGQRVRLLMGDEAAAEPMRRLRQRLATD